MNTCEMTNCKKKVFVTAFPDKNPVKLCQEHFIKEMGHLIDPNAPIVDMTEDKPTQEKQECKCFCHDERYNPRCDGCGQLRKEGCKHCTHSPLDNSLKDMDTRDTDVPQMRREFFGRFVGEEYSFDSNGNDYDNWFEEDPESVYRWLEQTISTEVLAETERIRKGISELIKKNTKHIWARNKKEGLSDQEHGWVVGYEQALLDLADDYLDNISNEVLEKK